ncbi:MAG: helix-turn-helix transcriptional regulator [Chloroflexi bacterium]|nr:helix-turn-helix transcriptional regulator [Chloroflexota bacterium]
MLNKVRDAEQQDWLQTGAAVAQALAHPVRLRILELLRNEGAYVMHLTTVLGRPQANISQHLAILRDAGLVTDEREGMTVVYRVRDPQVFELMDQMKTLARPAMGRREFGEPEMRFATRAGRGCNCHCPRCAKK